MKNLVPIIALVMLSACATQDAAEAETTADVHNQAIIDFIEVRELTQVDRIRSSERDGWQALSISYVIYKARRDRFLVEFARPCYELRDNLDITPDVRRVNANTIRAKFDTLRGCRISRIFAITREEVDELKNIGEAPGERN